MSRTYFVKRPNRQKDSVKKDMELKLNEEDVDDGNK